MRIDPHVHCRDEEWSDKATIAGTIRLAHDQGVDIIFDMPNLPRPVINEDRVLERLALVPKGEEQSYWTFVGLTGQDEQTDEAISCYYTIAHVIGLKMFAGKSVGDLSVIDLGDQRMIYRRLAERKFPGVIAVHCEEESCLRPNEWDPARPITHTLARPEQAELESVVNQCMLASEVDFLGSLHICHVSSPLTVRYIVGAKCRGVPVTCGVTPHHIMWDNSMMEGADGLLYKMNPPLRDKESVEYLREQLRLGMIDVIETDHAPHTLAQKLPPECLSGYPSLTLYHDFVTRYLSKLGLTRDRIKAMTYDNVVEIFGRKLNVI
jgi:dihydroorotase